MPLIRWRLVSRLPLRVGGRCQTPDGPGVVKVITNADRWHRAWVEVRLDSGPHRRFDPMQVEADIEEGR